METRQAPAPETVGVVIGNHTQKYTARNPAIRWLTERWVANLERTFGQVDGGGPRRALEVGCGEGVIAERMWRRWGEVVALDLPDAGLRADWRGRAGPRFLHASAQELPFADDQFDVVVAAEVLEHLPDPAGGLREMARVGRRHLVLSVPREPIFRSCNLVAGRYVRDLGNTPGHLNHWSKRGFVRFVSQVAEVRAVTSPFPWTTVWAELPDSDPVHRGARLEPPGPPVHRGARLEPPGPPPRLAAAPSSGQQRDRAPAQVAEHEQQP